ncbi:MAG TPA: E3 binding domain-containing protein [Gammaproteobacteria bacterium]
MDTREHNGSTPTDSDTRPAAADAPPPGDPDPETLADALAAHDAVATEAGADALVDAGSHAPADAAANAAANAAADAPTEAVTEGLSDSGAHALPDAGADALADAGTDALADAGADAPADAAATDEPEPPTLDGVVPDAEPPDELSPAVRRLVRQYDVDVRKIQGSGPAGRIRVADVMAYLGGRTYVPAEQSEQPEPPPENRAPARDEDRPAAAKPLRPSAPAPHARGEPEPVTLAPVTTVFECDLGAVLAHRKQLRQRNVDVVLTSYFLVAASEALRAVPEAAEGHEPVRIGAVLTFADAGIQTAMVDAPDGSAFESLQDRLLAVDKEFRFSARSAELNPRLIDLLVHHHGASGSVVATPTPIGEGHTASIGVGKVRREIVVGGGEDDAAPRIAARCYVSLSFYPDRLELARANRFMAQLVRVLEQWPAA